MQTDRSNGSDNLNKLNKKFKHDLKNLEKVADLSFINQDKITIKSASKSPRKLVSLQPALTNKIDLNKELINEHEKLNITLPGKNKLKPLINQDKHAVDLITTAESKQIPQTKQHKYPFTNDQYISVEELKNKVYKSTLGVLPVRQSQKLKELNFIMKGKPINKKIGTKQQIEIYDDDESADASNDEDDEEQNRTQSHDDDDQDSESNDESEMYNKIHANLNTPVTSAIGEGFSINQTPLYVFKTNFDFGLKEIKNQNIKKLKPAILPSTGTSGQAKFSERPKPSKKDTTLVVKSPRRLNKLNDQEKDSQENMRKEAASAADLQQTELESQLKDLINEAKDIAGTKSTTPNKSRKVNKTTDLPKAPTGQTDKTVVQNENLLLSTVEGLISAIKSGQIIREQEESNNRIKDILVSILDKETFETFETIFEKNKFSIKTESEKQDEVASLTTTSEIERNLIAMSKSNIQKEELESAARFTTTDTKSFREDSVSIFLPTSAKLSHRTTTSYDEEINAYLALLPADVTQTDVLNATSKKVKLFEREFTDHKKKTSTKELKTEEKYAKNLHLFCMFEHERRSSLLLPNELINVTRKFHTKNKFESQLIYSGRNALSREASLSSIKKSTQQSAKKETHTATVEEAAQRVFSKLTNTVHFDEMKTSIKIDELRQMNDSGFSDASFESWRQQAESVLREDFCLEAHKMEICTNELDLDPSLRFLRPAPPKMSVRPSEVRKNLYATYESLPPLDLNENTKSSTKSKSKESKRTQKSKIKAYSDLDSDETDELDDTFTTESESESFIFLERVLKRQYHSETDIRILSKQSQLNANENHTFDEVKLELKRTLSDSLVYDSIKKESKSDEFIKLDSNYSDAIDEAMYQKQQIKQEYEKKKRQQELEKKTSTEQDNASTLTKTNKTETEKNDNKSQNNQQNQENKYFPKTVYKDLVKEAVDADRKYVVEEKKRKKSIKKKVKTLNSNLLDHIRVEILTKNRLVLKRSESINRIRFPVRVTHPDDLIIRVPRTLIEQKRPSVPNIFDFEEYKRENYFEPELGDREWTRKIWNIWFDEVIPQLDGTGGRPPSVIEDKKPNRDVNQSQISKANTTMTSRQQNHTAVEDEDDKDNNEEKKANAKSPTPYDTYSQVNLYDDEVELKPNKLDAIHLLESEIDKLTKRLDNKLNTFDLTRRGTLYRKLGYLGLAHEDLSKAIEIEPNFVDAFWQRHLIYLTQDKKNEAIYDLQTLLKLNRTHSGAYISIADLYVERNDLPSAISNYSNAIKYDPQNYMAYFKRAKLYEIRNEMRMAMDDYLTTTRINPKFYDAWFRHGMNYYNNGNWHYAIVDFTELISNCPKNQSEARLYRGKCNLNLGEYQEALNDFSIALHLNPNDWQSYYHRGCLLRKIDVKQALQDLSASLLIESGYDNINSFLHRGIIYAETEKYDEAIKDFESALELDKEFAPAYCNLGIIYMNVNLNYWKAIKNFNNAIKSNPVYLRAYLCRAQAYRCIHDLKRAYIDYTKAIHLDPMNTQVYIYRGQVIYEMGDAKLASFCVQHAAFMNEGMNDKTAKTVRVETARSGSTSHMRTRKSTMTTSDESTSSIMTTANQSVTQRSVVFSFLKNYSKAISVLEHELKIKPDPEIFNLLGRVFMKAKKLKNAVESFEKSIDCVLEMIGVKDLKKNIQSYAKLNMSKDYQQKMIEALSLKGQCLLDLSVYQDAYNSFDKVIEMQPNNAYAYYNRGMARYHLNHPKCIQDFNKALSINPQLFEAFLGRACVYGLKDRFTKATLNCNEAAKICPKSVRAFLYRGALKYLSRSYEPALLDLTKAIELDQTCAIAYFNRALCYHKLKKYKHSLKDYSIVLLLGEYLKYKVYTNRGLLYFEIGNYSNALKDFISASSFDQTNINIQHMIGVSLHKLGRYHEAVEKLTETYDKNPKFYDAIISRGNAYIDFGTPEAFYKAQRDFELVLLKDPKNIDAHINLAYLFQMTGRYMKAWNQFTEALDICPSNIQLYEGRSIVCLQMSDTNAAIKDINHAIKLKRSAELYVNRGVIYQFMADNVNAMRDYQAAILIDSTYGLAYYNSANILLLHRQFSQAIEMLNLAIDKCNMKDESTYQNRAIAKAFIQDTPGAFRDLCEALKYDQYSTHIYMNRALLLFKMENYKLADKDLTTAIGLTPDDPLLYKIRADCRGKLELKEDAINDYKTFVDLNDRNEITKYHRRRQIKY